MSVSSLILDISDFCVLEGKIVDKILLSSNPDIALLYLYISRRKQNFTEQKALNELNFSKARYETALTELLSLNIIKPIANEQSQAKPYFEPKPKYSLTELKSAKKDTVFEVICDSSEKIFGVPLSEGYIKTFLYLYDALKMSAEVIIELISYLKNASKTIPTKSEIEREARIWVDLGIDTHNDAINYIMTKYEKRPLIQKMADALGIKDIKKDDEHYIINFLDMGFSPETVEFVVGMIKDENGRFSKKRLLNKLISLKDKNLFSKEAIISEYPVLNKRKSFNNTSDELEDWEIRALRRRNGGNIE